MIPWDELGEFYDSIVFSRWNAHVYSTALICGLSVYIVEALDLVYLVLQYERQTLSKIIFKIKYLKNLLWIVWYDYMKIGEWLLGVEYDVYHNVLYFLLTLIMRNGMRLLNYMI